MSTLSTASPIIPSAKHQVAKEWYRRIIAVAANSRLTPAAARAKVDSKCTVSSFDAALGMCAFASKDATRASKYYPGRGNWSTAPRSYSSELRSADATPGKIVHSGPPPGGNGTELPLLRIIAANHHSVNQNKDCGT